MSLTRRTPAEIAAVRQLRRALGELSGESPTPREPPDAVLAGASSSAGRTHPTGDGPPQPGPRWLRLLRHDAPSESPRDAERVRERAARGGQPFTYESLAATSPSRTVKTSTPRTWPPDHV